MYAHNTTIPVITFRLESTLSWHLNYCNIVVDEIKATSSLEMSIQNESENTQFQLKTEVT